MDNIPGTGLPCSVPQCREAAGTFHVQALPVSDSGGTGGTGSAALLKHVWNAHAIGAADQAPPDVKMQTEYTYDIEATGCGDSGKVCGVNLQPHGG